MLQQIQQGRDKIVHKIYVCILLCIVLIIIPFQQLRRALQYYDSYNKYTKSLNQQITQQPNSQLQLINFYPLLQRNPYHGVWQSSIKRSQYLTLQQGLIQIRTIKNNSIQHNNYDIILRIFDGYYKDNGYYDITINSASIKVYQRYQIGKILYQTISPLIAFYRKGYTIKLQEQKALYINKLKFKVYTQLHTQTGQVTKLKIQILISSEYSINVIGRELEEYQETFHDVLLAILLMGQFYVMGYGIYHILEGIISQKECVSRYSRRGFLFVTAFDVSQAIGLAYLGTTSTKRLAVFSIPILTIWVIIVVIQIRLLAILFQDQFNQNTLKCSLKMFTIFIIVCLFTYWANFTPLYFIIISLFGMFPQIYRNYKVGHKLKQIMQYYLCYILPHYFSIPYLRFYQYNVFRFQTNWTLCLICFIIILAQVALIFVQVQYGVRSILPKFLHPEELKYFLSQPDPEDDVCSICLISLKEKVSIENIQVTELKAIRGDQIYNSIVLTPCRHKFHIQCLMTSMKTKLECPNCRAILPPLEQFQ